MENLSLQLSLLNTGGPLQLYLFLWLNGWSRHVWYAILLNVFMNLRMSILGTLVPEGPWCVFHATRHHLHWGLFFWYSDLILDTTHTHTHTHTRTHTHTHTTHSVTSRLNHTHINIYLYQLLCAHSSYLCYIEWIIHWFTKMYFPQCLFYLKIIHLQKPYLLIRCYKTSLFLWSGNNTDINGVNKQNTHTHTKHSEKENTTQTLFLKGGGSSNYDKVRVLSVFTKGFFLKLQIYVHYIFSGTP